MTPPPYAGVTQPSRTTPPRAVALSLLALGVPIVATTMSPRWIDGDGAFLVWVPALLPTFLLAHYRRWKGASLAVAAGMATLALTQVETLVLDLEEPSPVYLLGIVSLLVAVAVGAGWIEERAYRARENADRAALTDALTGLPNRRHASLFLKETWASVRSGRDVAVVLFDLDHFKAVNEEQGHAEGDRVLAALAGLLTQHTRKTNLSARFGGEEFITILQDCTAEDAETFADDLRRRMSGLDFGWGRVTVSAGVCAARRDMGSPDVVVAAADRALYGAKERGRNQVLRATATRPRPAATRTDERDAPAPPTDLEGCRVLVVDDDDLTLRATTRALQRLGCDVLSTSSSRGALTTLANDPSVRVLVTDIIMPDLSGFTLADLAGKSHPGLPVLYVSGYPPEEVYWGGTPGGRSAFLGKPLDAGELRDALLRLLGSAPNAARAEAETPPVAPEASSEGPARGRADAVPTPTRPGRVLIVDDNPAVVASLQRYLHSAGYARPLGVTDPREVVETLRTRHVDLMVLDFAMEAMDGVEVLRAISGLVDEEEFFPVIMLTGEGDPEVRRRALEAGAMDFLDKPFDPIEVEVRIRNLLTTRFLTQRVARQRDTLEDEVAARTAELADTRSEILYRLARAAEYRDDVTGRHAERVGLLSSAVASALGLAPRDVDLLRRTAPLHDIGKIGVPDSILLKPSGLSDAEFEVMKSHTTIGAQILGGSAHRILEVAQAIALHHHERWDGEGYPDGLVGAQTPLEARIVAVADSFDAITHARPYKAALSPAEGLDEIERCSGTWYDPDVVTGLRLVKDRVGLEHLHELAAPLDPLRDTQKDNLAAGGHTGGRVGK